MKKLKTNSSLVLELQEKLKIAIAALEEVKHSSEIFVQVTARVAIEKLKGPLNLFGETQDHPHNRRDAGIEGWNAFYKAYPKKINPAQALKAWSALKPSEELVQTIIQAIEKQKASNAWREKKFIPNPATWIRAHGWLNEVEKYNPVKDPLEAGKCWHKVLELLGKGITAFPSDFPEAGKRAVKACGGMREIGSLNSRYLGQVKQKFLEAYELA